MTTDLRHRLTFAAAKARHQWHHRNRRASPIVVFSMAKTGSTSIASGLRAAGIGTIHQVHDLDPAFLAEEEAEYHWSGRPWRIWDAQQLLRRPATARSPWLVVSMVRDPIAQTVSAFFQPAVRRGYVHPDVAADELLHAFGDRLDRLPLHWFESHLLPTLGIDVYASDFDPAVGYRVIATPTVRLLLLRCEDLAAAAAGLAELLGREVALPVPRLNVGVEKDYAELYAAFGRALHPTEQQLENAYGSRMVRHFYAPAEIAAFRHRWASGTSVAGDPPAGPSSPDR